LMPKFSLIFKSSLILIPVSMIETVISAKSIVTALTFCVLAVTLINLTAL
jgi:hypothetical protein